MNVLLAALAALTLAGAAQAQVTPSGTRSSDAGSPGNVPAGIVVKGLVARPGTVHIAELRALKQTSVTGSFDSMSGKQTHSWTGPLLLDILGQAGVTDEPGKRTHMRHVILEQGSDGYGASIALGEIEAKGEGKHVIVALTQDGKPLAAPRMIVAGDASLTRCVHDLAVLDVR